MFHLLLKTRKLLATSLMAAIIGVLMIAATSSSAAWTSSGQSIVNWRSQPLETTITNKNVSNLSPLFAIPTDGDVTATPNISGGVAYFPDFSGSLWAVNATTGATIWKVNLSNYTGIAGTISRATPTSATKGMLLVVTQHAAGRVSDAYLLVINQRDGSLVGKVQVDDQVFSGVTSSPSVFQGVAYLGVSSGEELWAGLIPNYPCCVFRGSVVAVSLADFANPAVIWKSYTVPANIGYSGNGVWGSEPVVDPSRNTVFVGTGNNYSAACSGSSCINPAGNFTDAVLALDMTTGAIKWADPLMGLASDDFNAGCFIPPYTACPPNAGPDYDFGNAPMKLKANIGGKTVDILGIGQKSGDFWALNPDTGAVIWKTTGGPGSAYGGMEWGSATDGTRIYYQISNQYGIPYTLKDGTTTNGGLWGALDPATGAILWQTADPSHSMAAGAVSVANGVVYAGSFGNPVGYTPGSQPVDPAVTGPTYFALDAATGKILWSYASGGSVNAGAAIANGVVYWGTGYGKFNLGTAKHMFYAFSGK